VPAVIGGARLESRLAAAERAEPTPAPPAAPTPERDIGGARLESPLAAAEGDASAPSERDIPRKFSASAANAILHTSSAAQRDLSHWRSRAVVEQGEQRRERSLRVQRRAHTRVRV
jgi:hypothetical protein